MAEITGNTTETAAAVNEAENTGGDSKGGADNATAVSTSEGATVKTFTQSEVDDIVKARLERATKGQPTKDELKAFREWQNSQKTAEQLTAEKLSAAENGKAEAEKNLALANAKIAALSKGISAQSLDDVITLAQSKVTDDVDISKAIDIIIGKYPSLCGTSKLPIIAGSTKGVPASQTDNDVRAIMGLPPIK